MKLLQLDDGRLSLEFEPRDWSTVRARIRTWAKRHFSDVHLTEEATHSILTADDVEFIVLNDWEEPCLISTSPRGDVILRSINRPSRSRAYRGRSFSPPKRALIRDRRAGRELVA
jgi:hypothetical protein